METPLGIEVNRAPEMSVGDWLIVYLITAIPVVNVIMLFVWAFGNNDNQTKSTWAKAMLIWMAIAVGIYLIFMMAFGTAYLAGLGTE